MPYTLAVIIFSVFVAINAPMKIIYIANGLSHLPDLKALPSFNSIVVALTPLVLIAVLLRWLKSKRSGLSFLPSAFSERRHPVFLLGMLCVWLGHTALLLGIVIRAISYSYNGLIVTALVLYFGGIVLVEQSMYKWNKSLATKNA